MKRLVVFLAAVMVIFGTVFCVAEDQKLTEDNAERGVEVQLKYHIGASYTITVPGTEITLSSEVGADWQQIGSVDITTMTLEPNQTMHVNVKSEHGYKLIGQGRELNYELRLGDGEKTFTTANGQAVNELFNTTSATRKQLWCSVTGITNQAGDYTDTLTFTIALTT